MEIIVMVIILLFIVMLGGLNSIYKRTNHFNNQFVDVRKFEDSSNRSYNLQIVNLGSNQPKFGFDYSESKVTGENWAVGPQTFEYDFKILRFNTQYLTKGAFVLIPVCLLSFFLYRKQSPVFYMKYLSCLPASDVLEYSWFNKLKNNIFPLLFLPKRIRFLVKDIESDKRLFLEENPMKKESELQKDADFGIDCWNREFSITLPNPILSEKNEEDIRQNIIILRDLVDYCMVKGFNPVITILPVTKKLSSKFTDDFIDNHILKYIQEANNVSAPIMNYLKDERFSDESLYINSFFMNRVGARKFTNQVLTDLGL